MKVLYSHHGMKGKNGWGRTFYMAQGLADLGHDVEYFIWIDILDVP